MAAGWRSGKVLRRGPQARCAQIALGTAGQRSAGSHVVNAQSDASTAARNTMRSRRQHRPPHALPGVRRIENPVSSVESAEDTNSEDGLAAGFDSQRGTRS